MYKNKTEFLLNVYIYMFKIGTYMQYLHKQMDSL